MPDNRTEPFAHYRLRPMTDADLERVRDWRNAAAVRRMMYSTHEISPTEHRDWWHRMEADERTRLCIFEYRSEAIALVHYSGYTGPDGRARLGFYSDVRRARRQIGAALEFHISEYAFDKLRVRRLEGEVIEFNAAVLRMHLRQGASLEGVQRKAYVRDGVAYDVYQLAMLREDWNLEIRPTLLKRALDRPPSRDWSGRRVRDRIAAERLPGREFRIGGVIAQALVNALTLDGARLTSQSLHFEAALPDGELALSARVLTHLQHRLLFHVRLRAGTRDVGRGYFEFRLPAIIPASEAAD